MTGFMHERELSRRSFVKRGGMMVVGFSLAGGAVAGKVAAAGVDPFASTSDPFASNGPYDPMAIDSWIQIHADNTASILTGRVDLGQGTATGLLMIAGEELNMNMAQLVFVRHDTDVTPNSGGTNGSSSISTAGPEVRNAAAHAMQALLGLASTSLGVPVGSLSASAGVVSGGGQSVTYGELVGGKLFNVEMTTTSLNPGVAPAKTPGQYTLVTTSPPRIDIPAKVTGEYTYVHNIHLPGMLHGRVVRPRGQGAYGDGTMAAIESIDESSIKSIPNVQVVRRGNFLGVVAPHEYDAIQAASQLKVTWADPPVLPGDGDLFGTMRAQDSAGLTAQKYSTNTGNVDAAFASAAHVVSQTYSYHYNGHVPIGPSCCVADVTPTGAHIYVNTQDAYGQTRPPIAQILGLPSNAVRVQYWEGSSSYGQAPYNDAAEAAAVLSQAVGKPVRVQFMRWDEHGWDNYGPAQLMDISGGVDAHGNIVGYDYSTFAIPYFTTAPTIQMLGQPFVSTGSGSATSAAGQYSIASYRVLAKSLPLFNSYFKCTFLRAPLGPQSYFGSEQLIDELAHAANMDPIAFRIQNIDGTTLAGSRAINVLNALVQAASWEPRAAASNLSGDTVVTGRGMAMSAKNANAAFVQVNKKTGKITAVHMYAVQDAGLTINPGLVQNQMTGCQIMGASRALCEEVAFTKSRVTSLDWVSYPIMRFKDSPAVTTVVVQRTDQVSSGSGEPSEVPVAAALANAFFDATGVRVRQAPMTPARVRATLQAAVVA
jgi:nicotinate dehydrogenase subunit B